MDPDDSWMVEYEDLDRGAEYIEDLILERAAKLRRNWLICDSFRKIHSEAQLKLKFDLFERIGSEFGHELRKFATFEGASPTYPTKPTYPILSNLSNQHYRASSFGFHMSRGGSKLHFVSPAKRPSYDVRSYG